MKEKKSQTEIEWEERTLCVDESCIGVIGPDGRCKECGKSFESEQPEPSTQPPPETEDQTRASEAGGIEEASVQGEASEENSQADIEWEKRTLCVDESCIGVIGPDGRCKECGKPFGSK